MRKVGYYSYPPYTVRHSLFTVERIKNVTDYKIYQWKISNEWKKKIKNTEDYLKTDGVGRSTNVR